MNPTVIHIAADHAGFATKEIVKAWLLAAGYLVEDHGAYDFEPNDDFPSYMLSVATAVALQASSCGLLFGGSGQGEAMAANRVRGVRATVYYGGNPEIITLSRTHNDANVLSFGARFVTAEEAKECIMHWLATEPSTDAKYHRRNEALDAIDYDR